MTTRVRVRALAKINLDLRVLGKRLDGYHELRTVYQTISLADRLSIAFTPARRTAVILDAEVDIPDNLVIRAARACLDEMRVAAKLEFSLNKRIPMGAGLGGGSSDAAAVLLALPVLARRPLPVERLLALAGALGSDVPFFLLGGTAVGLGRGDELYPLPDPALPPRGVLVAPGLHVSTAEAYRRLRRGALTKVVTKNTISIFQSRVWSLGGDPGVNDFEPPVFAQFPALAVLKRRLEKQGAEPAMMSGSGSSLFGLFRTPTQEDCALKSFRDQTAFPFSLVSRTRYRRLWWRWLGELTTEGEWPPRNRYSR